MINLVAGEKVSLLVRRVGTGRKKGWIEKQGIFLEENKEMILIQFKNYRESFMLKDFNTGEIKIRGI